MKISLRFFFFFFFFFFLPYMRMATILFNGMEPFEQIVDIPLTEGPMYNLVKIGQAVSEKKPFKDYMMLNLYKDLEQGRITPRGHNFDCN